jgi:hypothetical protein
MITREEKSFYYDLKIKKVVNNVASGFADHRFFEILWTVFFFVGATCN